MTVIRDRAGSHQSNILLSPLMVDIPLIVSYSVTAVATFEPVELMNLIAGDARRYGSRTNAMASFNTQYKRMVRKRHIQDI
jgi:hypothetical protein